MTTTMLAAFALAGAFAPAATPEPNVQTDYARALKVAAAEQKPVAVLIGAGDSFAKLMRDANLSAETKKALGDKFVCVSVDVNTPAGKELAAEFQMADGLVISTAGGAYQSVRHAGAVTATDLAKHTGTLTSAPVATSAASAPAVVCANGTCSLVSSSFGATANCASGNCSLSGGTSVGTCASRTCGTAAPSGCATGTCGTATMSGCASGTCGTGYAAPTRGGFFRRR
jgi:hypothetical protein